MAVVSTVVSSNLRLVDGEGANINSFRQINAQVKPQQLSAFVTGVGAIRGNMPAATFLTVTSELKSD